MEGRNGYVGIGGNFNDTKGLKTASSFYPENMKNQGVVTQKRKLNFGCNFSLSKGGSKQ